MTAEGCGVSFEGVDGNVSKLIGVVLPSSVNILQITELCIFKG